MSRGPIPLPTHLKKMMGNPGKRPLNESEPKPKAVTFIEPPTWFDEPRQKLWGVICKELKEIGILHTTDRIALERYTDGVIRWRELAIYVRDKYGTRTTYAVRYPNTPAVKDESGKIITPEVHGSIRIIKPVPEVAQLQELSTHLLRLEQHFGLTPSSRSRLTGGLGGEEDDDDFSDCDE